MHETYFQGQTGKVACDRWGLSFGERVSREWRGSPGIQSPRAEDTSACPPFVRGCAEAPTCLRSPGRARPGARGRGGPAFFLPRRLPRHPRVTTNGGGSLTQDKTTPALNAAEKLPRAVSGGERLPHSERDPRAPLARETRPRAALSSLRVSHAGSPTPTGDSAPRGILRSTRKGSGHTWCRRLQNYLRNPRAFCL